MESGDDNVSPEYPGLFAELLETPMSVARGQAARVDPTREIQNPYAATGQQYVRQHQGVMPSVLDQVRPPPIMVPNLGESTRPRLNRKEEIPRNVTTSSVHSGESISSQNRLAKAQRVPVGPTDRFAPMLYGGTPQQSLQPTPMVGSVGPQARVNVIQAGVGVVGMANPIMTEALRSSLVQKFSGRAEDFGEFEKQWKLHLRLMYGASGGVLPDEAVLLTLKKYLDDASATVLVGKMGLDPNLSYYTFWESLRSKFLRDARTMHRQNWRSVRLQMSTEKLTLQEWERFQAQYVSRRDLVEDWTDAEDQSYVFAAIPSYYQSKVLGETGRRRNGKRWVRVMIPQGKTQQEIIQLLEMELGYPLRVESSEKRHFVVACDTDQDVNALMEWDGSNIHGRVITVSRAQYSMTGDDLFAFVRRLLEEEEELRNLQRAYGAGGSTPRANVKAVHDQSPSPGKKVQTQGKNGSPFRRPPRGGKKDNKSKKESDQKKKVSRLSLPQKRRLQ